MEKWRRREDLAVLKLTAAFLDSQKVDSLTSMMVSPAEIAPMGNRNRETRSAKGGDSIGIVYQD